ncbi:hypothetical protein [Streptomyces sp. NRRL S-146]|uniref:hypothetical protein n=1 Tax=Streptomyces sp. NRRL S-146 TaxID=1463884 RepID=UPI00068B6DD9|nr:hypothetical protein [Streptomyces sp. NRRL S-146]
MEPTESAVPGSRLRLRRMAVAWRAVREAVRPAGRPGAEVRAVGQYTPDGRGGAGRAADGPGAQPITEHTPGLTGADDADGERHQSWPALPAAVVAAAGYASGLFSYESPSRDTALPDDIRASVPDAPSSSEA